MRRDRPRAYREIEKMKKGLSGQMRLVDKYRKRLSSYPQSKKYANSLRTKTNTLLKGYKFIQTQEEPFCFITYKQSQSGRNTDQQKQKNKAVTSKSCLQQCIEEV